ncbi:MAG: hypothetical protein ACRDH6_03870 [Actinomycetota bacterium]
MAVSERDRHELYDKLEAFLGRKPTETMMSLLPPVGWADVATKRDLEAMESRLSAQIMRMALTVIIPTILAALGLAFGAARLA